MNFTKYITQEKKRKRVSEHQVPVSVSIYPGSYRVLLAPYPTRIRWPTIRVLPVSVLDKKNTRIHIRKNGYFHYPYPLHAGYTRPVFTPSCVLTVGKQ